MPPPRGRSLFGLLQRGAYPSHSEWDPRPGGDAAPTRRPPGVPRGVVSPPPRPCGPPAGDRGRPVTAFSRRDGGGAPPGVGGQGRSPRFWGYPLPKARTAPLGSYPSQPTSPIP